MSAVTTDRVEELVAHSLDGIAANDYQAIALHNPATPEVDSLLERIDTLHSYNVPPAVVDQLRGDVWLVVEWNGRERQCQRTVAGNGERIARDLERFSLKRAARTLGPVLDAIANKLDDRSRDWPALLAGIERIVPTDVLRSRSLAHELGRGRAPVLHRLLREGMR
jgi:hypothetical protein